MTASTDASAGTGIVHRIGIRLMITFLALSLAYVVANIVLAAPPHDLLRDRAGYADIPELPTAETPESALRSVRLPYVGPCCRTRFAVFRFDLAEPSALGPQPAILITNVYNLPAVYVNGKLIASPGRLSASPSIQAQRPLLFRLPTDMPAGTRLDVIVAREAGSKTLYPVYIGDHDRLHKPYLKQRRLRVDIPEGVAAVCIFVSVMCFAAAPLFRTRGLLYALGGATGGWAVLQTSMLVSDMAASISYNQAIIDGLYYVAFYFTLAMVLLFFVEWTSVFRDDWPRGRAQWRRLASGPWSAGERRRLWQVSGVAVLAFGTWSAALIAREPGSYPIRFLALVATWLAVPVVLFCLFRVIAFYRNGVRGRWLELLAFVVVIVAAFGDILIVILLRVDGVLLNVATVYFLFALLLSLASRAQSVFEAAHVTNIRLNEMVADRERQIVAGMDAMREREREATLLEERTRIMRDMHDGVGGQLLSLMVGLRKRDGLGREEVGQAISRIVTDLRLMIDSLDGVGDSLDITLASFQERIRPQLDDAGVELVWLNRLDRPAAGFGPDAVLQIYRILQEAVTNVVRHSGATRLVISVGRSLDQPETLEISLRDNGSGGLPDAPVGKGMPNMKARAARLGGRLLITRQEPGVEVRLILPERRGD